MDPAEQASRIRQNRRPHPAEQTPRIAPPHLQRWVVEDTLSVLYAAPPDRGEVVAQPLLPTGLPRKDADLR